MPSRRDGRCFGAALAVLLGVLLTAAPVGVAAPVSAAAALSAVPDGSSVLFRLTDPRLDEASGIARGIRSPGVVYVQNDSGDSARFFALSIATGQVLAVYDVPGASNVDWEDLAVARDARGVPSIWIADIGDNNADRAEVRVYRVDEPVVPLAAPGVERPTGAAQVWRLRYPGGARDSEALAVAPGGAMTIFDKTVFGVTTAFAVPGTPDPAHVQIVRVVGGFSTSNTGTAGGPNPFGTYTVTGASLSPDGTILAVRTYTDAYLWPVRGGDVGAALKVPPKVIALPAQPQGEGISVDAGRLLIDSERVGSTVWSVPLPLLPASSTASSTATTSTATATTPTSASTASGSADQARTPGATDGYGVNGDLGVWPWAVGGGVLLFFGVSAAVLTRRRAP